MRINNNKRCDRKSFIERFDLFGGILSPAPPPD
jgi:hypothetical protein